MRRLCSLLLILILVLPLSAWAEGIRFRNVDHFSLNSDESLVQELWLIADRIDIQGTVEENLFILGGDALFPGRFKKDLWALTRTADFNGQIQQSARLMGSGPLRLNGTIESGLMALSSRVIQLGPDAQVGHDAILAGHDISTQGTIGGNLRIIARQVTLGGHIQGTVRLQADDIVVLPGTRIGGDLVYTAPRELVLDRHVHLDGRLIRSEPEPERLMLPWAGNLLLQGLLFSAAMLTGIAFVAVFPKYSGRAVKAVRQSLWKCGLVGGIALFLIPMLAFFALITVIGIPLGVLMLFGYTGLLYLSKIIVGLALGGLLLGRRGPQPLSTVIAALALGLLCLYIMATLPMVGSVAVILISILGVGGLILGWANPSPEESRTETG